MANFKRYGNVYQQSLPFVTAGIWAKPPWFTALRRSPPELKIKWPKPPEVFFPEDALYKTLLIKKPLLELQTDSPATFQRTIGHRFSQAQYKLMTKKMMSEEEAFAQCDKDFDAEIKGLEEHLDAVQADGAQRVSFHAITKNASQHARVSNTISKLLEERINLQLAGKLFHDPLDSPIDSYERRAAKLKRLAEDPAIGHVKSLFRPRKPPVLIALNVLVTQPNSPDTDFYTEELRGFMKQLAFALYSFDDVHSPSAEREEIRNLKKSLSEVSNPVKTVAFAKLTKEEQTSVITLVQAGMKYKLVAKASEPSINLSTHQQATRIKVKDLQKMLSVEETERTLEERLGKRNYALYQENQWWIDSAERKMMFKRVALAGDGEDMGKQHKSGGGEKSSAGDGDEAKAAEDEAIKAAADVPGKKGKKKKGK